MCAFRIACPKWMSLRLRGASFFVLAGATALSISPLALGGTTPPRRSIAQGSSTARGPEIRRNSPGQNWFKRVPRSIDKVKWGWLAAADGAGPSGTSSEVKFNIAGVGRNRVAAGQVLAGFTKNKTGDLGSTATATGTGSSAVVAGAKRPYQVSWVVDATGTLGAPQGLRKPSWKARATGSDPFHISIEDLEDFELQGEENVSLLFPVGLSTMTWDGEESGASLDVSFDLAGVSYSLFQFGTDVDGFLEPGPDINALPFDVTIHQLSTMEADIVAGQTEITIAALSSSLAADLVDGSLDQSMNLAFELTNVAVSDIGVADAFFSASLSVWAGESVPAPGPMALALVGGGVIFGRRRRVDCNEDARNAEFVPPN